MVETIDVKSHYYLRWEYSGVGGNTMVCEESSEYQKVVFMKLLPPTNEIAWR